MEKARIPPRLRQRVIDRDGMRCVYCGLDLERDRKSTRLNSSH